MAFAVCMLVQENRPPEPKRKSGTSPAYPLADVGCHAILGFSEETGDYAILGIAGIRHFTCRQGHPAPSPVLLFNSLFLQLVFHSS